MTLTQLINGRPEDQISASDRGLFYGDGLFETVRVQQGHLCLWSLHLQRLRSGCERLGIAVPDSTLLEHEAVSLLCGEDLEVIKIIVTRGVGQRGFAVTGTESPTRIVMHQKFPRYKSDFWRSGIRMRFCRTRLAIQPALAGLKHLNCLQQVLARREWDDPEIQEGIMLNNDNEVVEGCMSNIFLVKNNRIMTPDLSLCGVAGVMRHHILKLAQDLGIELDITSVTPQDLRDAEEIFVSNSLIGVWPVRQLEQHLYTVGPITQEIMERLQYFR
ncbi:MAG: aminodeoxychorismate lyase [Gammaproteobacteria bacterium]|nr:aminodeoxychorismate lyase [Gammaproteobacteria bacterium]MDH5799377.1 aminodeoxychorismate lyase [Gammaproteobacteria bacterium]